MKGKRVIKYKGEMKEHLSAFIGISSEKLENYFQCSVIDTFKTELECFVRPQGKDELDWYYRTCRSQFIHNATHGPWPLLGKWISPHNLVLDYGAGVGQNCFYVMRLGAFPEYFEISSIQREFFGFVCKREGVNIPIIHPYIGEGKTLQYDPIGCITNKYDIVLFKQILEHIPRLDAEVLLDYIVKHINSSGLILEDSPFGTHDILGLKSWTKNQFEDFMRQLSMNKLAQGVWKKQ